MKLYVQHVVADITPDPSSDLTGVEAAFLAIANHGERGVYEFDMAEDYKARGGEADHPERVRVTVEWPDYAEAHSDKALTDEEHKQRTRR